MRAADEVWVTSSSKEVLAIVDARRQAGRRRQARARVFRRMYELYQEFKQKVMRAGKREAVAA